MNIKEIIEGLFYFGVEIKPDQFPGKFEIFSTDDIFKYVGYREDFGPLNIGMVHNYYCDVKERLAKCKETGMRLAHISSSNDRQNIMNATYLIGTFQILFLHYTVKKTMLNLKQYERHLFLYKDASGYQPIRLLSLEDALKGLYKAYQLRFYNPDLFDVIDYKHYDQEENGNLNWIIPGRMLAFSGPEDLMSFDGNMHSLGAYIPFFLKNGINCVIRLNRKKYNSKKLTIHGIDHYELHFKDGETPNREIISKFISICLNHKNGIAIHCRAGLGRTGTLIAYYLMMRYGFTARESISWVRICRPASIMGKQHYWLLEQENMCLRIFNTMFKKYTLPYLLCYKKIIPKKSSLSSNIKYRKKDTAYFQ